MTNGKVHSGVIWIAGVVVVICAVLGVYGWVSVTGASTERFMQVLAVLTPTIAGLVTMGQVLSVRKRVEETKEIISPVENHTERARLAYHAYADAVGWKSFQGEPLPPFEKLSVEIVRGWLAASKAANGEIV